MTHISICKPFYISHSTYLLHDMSNLVFQILWLWSTILSCDASLLCGTDVRLRYTLVEDISKRLWSWKIHWPTQKQYVISDKKPLLTFCFDPVTYLGRCCKEFKLGRSSKDVLFVAIGEVEVSRSKMNLPIIFVLYGFAMFVNDI
jgi:hypothetical protein